MEINSNGICHYCGTKSIRYGIEHGSYTYYCIKCNKPITKDDINQPEDTKMDNNKQFTIIKIGYRAGGYGCIAEYFNCIYTDAAGLHTIFFNGLYGAEERIAEVLKQAGYKQKWTPSIYGKLTIKDIPKNIMYSEHVALEELKKELNITG